MYLTTDKDFPKTLEMLHDPEAHLTTGAIYSLSDLSPAHRATLAEVWPTYPLARRRQLIRRLAEISETNFEMNFEAIHLLALDDEDEEVRIAAIGGLWENETPTYMHRLIEMMTSDLIAQVRAAAASDLGRFVLLGELGKFPEEQAMLAQDALVGILGRYDEHPDVRRRALESIANCGREGVSEWIEDAYAEPSVEMRASALFAMGRSCDLRWRFIILDELQSDEPEMLYEGARAAGELELRDAVPSLADLLLHEDREIQEMAVWALGEIGGEEASDVLNAAAESAPDEDFAEAVEDALGAASLVSGDLRFDMFDFEEM